MAKRLQGVYGAVEKVRLRLRAQAALQGLVYGLFGGALILTVAVLLARFEVISRPALHGVSFAAAGLGVLTVLGFALRRIDPLVVAARIDQSHALHDRLASALQFVGVGSTPAPDPQQALRELAIADAERVAQGVDPGRAAPFSRPSRLGWLGLSLVALVASYGVKIPRPAATGVPPIQRLPAAEPRLTVDGDLLEPEKEELRELLKQAEKSGDTEAAEILQQMQKLLEQVERGEISRKQAFEMLAELERRLAAHAQDGTLDDMKERLRKAGSELGEAKLAKDVSQALLKEDLEKAQQELKKLSNEALSRAQKNAKSKDEKDALAKAMERAADAMKQEKSAKQDKSEPRELDKQKDEWKDKTKSEEQTRRMQELQEEERRLKKKLEQNPNDEETERRLKKTQRELEQLEREKQERQEAQRELEQLERDMQRAAEEMRKQLEKMTPEQRKAFEKMAEDLQRMQQQMKQMQQRGQGQQQMQKQVTVALGSIKQVLRRIARSGGQGQGQGQGQNGQNGANGQGQGQGQGGSMKDYMNRAKGKGGGNDNEVLVEGEGNGNEKDGQKVMILGEGNDPVIIPGLGEKGGDKGPGQGQPGGQGGDRPGNEHDPNLLGNPTQIDSKRRLTRIYGKEAAGPTRSETILGAAEKGFATQPYRRVYHDYSAVSEKVMSQQKVPPGYRFYVKRYFQMIKPRE